MTLGNERDYGVGMFFLPQDELPRNQDKEAAGDHLRKKEGLIFAFGLASRCPPMPGNVLGHKARDPACPASWQAFCGTPGPPIVPGGMDFDRKLYVMPAA